MKRREDFLPFSRPCISEEVMEPIAECIRSGWVAMGPKVLDFESAFAERVGACFTVATSSATAGLHATLMAMGVGRGDEVITTTMTFASTVNAILFCGAKPVLVDISRADFNIDVTKLEQAVTPRTKAIVPVHFAGLPCDMDAIETIAQRHGLMILEDGAHALGASYKGKPIGSNHGKGHATVFSFHPTKNITTAEGGMVCTEDEDLAEYVSLFRQNGMSKGAWNRYAASGTAHYDIPFPGLKYQMNDIQAVIGLSQLKQLEQFNNRRREISRRYETALGGMEGVALQQTPSYDHLHSRHIFPVLIQHELLGITREQFMEKMKQYNIGTAIHYTAIHQFSYYGQVLGKVKLSEADYVSDRIVSLPLFPAMSDEDVDYCIAAIKEICE